MAPGAIRAIVETNLLSLLILLGELPLTEDTNLSILKPDNV
jgi:hypothetical protein